VRDPVGGNRHQLRYSQGGRRAVNSGGKAFDSGADETIDVQAANGDKRFVTFYITNFLERANYWYLRKGFEVCGILDDVYVAPTCNARGQAYGFVRFLNVRVIEKLEQALNNVWFGDLRVWARVVRFKRKETEVGVKAAGEGASGSKMVAEENIKGVQSKIETLEVEGKFVKGKVLDVGEAEGVRVGKVLVRLGGKVGRETTMVGKQVVPPEGMVEKVNAAGAGKQNSDTVITTNKCKMFRKYCSLEKDVS